MVRHIARQHDWPQSWDGSYNYDLLEIYGSRANPGYSYAYRNRLNQTMVLIKAVLPLGSTVLDVGAAQGNLSLLLAEAGYKVTWNDLRAELADYVRLKYEYGDLDFAPGNAFDLAFSELFDAVVINEVIEHVAHPDEFLRKTAALVRPGGYIIMTTPNGAYIRNRLPRFSDCADPSIFEAEQFKPDADGHIFLLWPDEIERLAAAAGLHLQTLSLITNSLTNGHMKMSALLRWMPHRLVIILERASQRLLPEAAKRRLMVTAAARFHRPS